ncbi:hypothetical protein HOY82DRAFT_372675 [Tuber indicum]|nr:hypothetical protein HOY82DRAFT_372675 [Tuber indicum]
MGEGSAYSPLVAELPSARSAAGVMGAEVRHMSDNIGMEGEALSFGVGMNSLPVPGVQLRNVRGIVEAILTIAVKIDGSGAPTHDLCATHPGGSEKLR